jgi:beta-glucanase (GH16 family)
MKAQNYTSARLKTQGLQQWAYGRIEARIKVPYGQGIWPAFWTLGSDIEQVGWPNSGELDIMEHIGREPATVYGTVHGPGYSGANGVGGNYTLSSGSLSDNFHVFAVEWTTDEIRWYIDNTQYASVTPDDVPGEWVFDHPFFIILNVAVGGDWPGVPDGTTVFPQFMYVDYVRVYQ